MKPEALVFADDRPMSTSDDLYQWAVDAENLIRAQQARIVELEDDLQFVERWAVHHGSKPSISAQEALSCIQHYPAIHEITKSYKDGKRPDTFNPYARIAELESQLAAVQRSTHHGHEWVRVTTVDGQHAVHLSLSQLAYDEDGAPYVVAHADDEQGTQLRFYLNTQSAAQEMDALDATRYRFARDSDSEFAICYWDELAGYNGEWVCRGSNGDAIDLLDAAIAAQAEQRVKP